MLYLQLYNLLQSIWVNGGNWTLKFKSVKKKRNKTRHVKSPIRKLLMGGEKREVKIIISPFFHSWIYEIRTKKQVLGLDGPWGFSLSVSRSSSATFSVVCFTTEQFYQVAKPFQNSLCTPPLSPPPLRVLFSDSMCELLLGSVLSQALRPKFAVIGHCLLPILWFFLPCLLSTLSLSLLTPKFCPLQLDPEEGNCLFSSCAVCCIISSMLAAFSILC